MPTLEAIAADLEQEVSSLDGALLDGAGARARFELFARIKKYAEAGQVLVAPRVSESNQWQGEGHQSCADWMAAQNGEAVGRAAQTLSTGQRLQELEATADAVRRGDLSVDQAAVVSDAAVADPGRERQLLNTAGRETFKNLKAEGQRIKAAATSDQARRERVHRERSVKQWVTEDGVGKTLISGPPADQVKLLELLRPYHEKRFRENRKTGARDTYENRQYDAFMDVLDRARVIGGDGGELGKLPGGQNVKIIINIDHTAFVRGHTVAGETCEIPGLGPVPVSAVKDLIATGDPFIAVVIKKGVDIVNVAHAGRGLNAHQRTAMEATRIECMNIGCNSTVAIQMDHKVPYSVEQITELRNQRPLCPHDHNLRTHHGWELVEGENRRAFVPPGHPDHPGPPRAPDRSRERQDHAGAATANRDVTEAEPAPRPPELSGPPAHPASGGTRPTEESNLERPIPAASELGSRGTDPPGPTIEQPRLC